MVVVPARAIQKAACLECLEKAGAILPSNSNNQPDLRARGQRPKKKPPATGRLRVISNENCLAASYFFLAPDTGFSFSALYFVSTVAESVVIMSLATAA